MRRDIETIGRALSKVGAGGQTNKHNRFAAPLDDEQAASTILHPSLCAPHKSMLVWSLETMNR